MTVRVNRFETVDIRCLNPNISQTVVAGEVVVKIDCSQYAKNKRLLIDNGHKQVNLKLTKTGCGTMFYCPKCNKRHGVLLANDLACWHCAKEPAYMRNAGMMARKGIERMRSRIFFTQQHIDAAEHRALVLARKEGMEAELVMLIQSPDLANRIGTAQSILRMQKFSEMALALAQTSDNQIKDIPILGNMAARATATEIHARNFYNYQYKNSPLSANEKNSPRLREDAVSNGARILPIDPSENSTGVQRPIFRHAS